MLPFKDGRAVVDTFLVTSAKIIAQYFENHINADYAYFVMAKPLVYKAPSFCRFKYSDVLARWNLMTEMAKNQLKNQLILVFTDIYNKCKKVLV